MSVFQRYAVYYLPDSPELAKFGAAWLGWDVQTGQDVAQPDVPGLEQATATPRKYGFHGTLKPPFRLADGKTEAELLAAVDGLAKTTAPVEVAHLELAQIGRFLALIPGGDQTHLSALAFNCVSRLDGFRLPASPEELARRRSAGLTPRQDELLLQWGYPYVADEFRFHLTLTGRLDDDAKAAMFAAAKAHMPELPQPFVFSSIAVAGEGADGRFRELHRYALTG